MSENQIFISYSSMDRNFIESELLEVFAKSKYNPWYDIKGITTGEFWEREIRNNLLSSDGLLLVMSPNSARSEWVQAELQVAFGPHKLPVIPLMIEDCSPLDFHIMLPGVQYLDFQHNKDRALEDLAERLNNLEEPNIVKKENISIESELAKIVGSLLSRFEIKHLKNLVRKKTQYTGRRSMRHEIRHLCDLGILVRKEGKLLGDMKNEEKCDLSDFVELTEIGRSIAEELTKLKDG